MALGLGIKPQLEVRVADGVTERGLYLGFGAELAREPFRSTVECHADSQVRVDLHSYRRLTRGASLFEQVFPQELADCFGHRGFTVSSVAFSCDALSLYSHRCCERHEQ